MILHHLQDRSSPAQKDYFLSSPTTVNLPLLAAATPNKKRPQTSLIRRRRSEGASQSSGKLPQRRILGRLRDAMRMAPCGHGACGVTFSGYRCKPFVLPVLFGECVRLLPLLAPKATKKAQSHRPTLLWAMSDCAFSRQRSDSLTNICVRAS